MHDDFFFWSINNSLLLKKPKLHKLKTIELKKGAHTKVENQIECVWNL